MPLPALSPSPPRAVARPAAPPRAVAQPARVLLVPAMLNGPIWPSGQPDTAKSPPLLAWTEVSARRLARPGTNK
jgi:hypothetical protein